MEAVAEEEDECPSRCRDGHQGVASSPRRSRRIALLQRRSFLCSFRAGEQPTSSQRYSSSARLLHSGIPYVGLTSFVTGFDCSLLLNGRLSPAWPLISHIFISGDERNAHQVFSTCPAGPSLS